MSDTTALPEDLDERLGLLADAIAEGAAVSDTDSLCERFALPRELVEQAFAAVHALDEACGEDLPADLAVDVPLPPNHEFVEELGRGGMGTVYRVHHRALGRDVALKLLRPSGHATAQLSARFDREIRSLARLRHPHIVSVFEGGEVDGCMYFTMELVEGSTLQELIAAGLGLSQATKILRQVALAVEHAHQQGIIHRDLKPSNVLVDEDGEAYVVDFGLARESGERERDDAPTLSGQIVGTPAYMSPEQAAGVPVGEATDVYALGAILYECITGERPFEDRPVAELIWAVMHEEVPRPRSKNPSIPRPLEIVCQHAMHKDASRRYPSAKAFADDLQRFSDGQPILAQPPGPIERSRLWLRRRGSHLVTAALAILLASVATYTGFGREADSDVSRRNLDEGRRQIQEREYGAARVAFAEAAAHSEHTDQAIAWAGWLEATASRIAELVRLDQTERARALLDECRARQPQIDALLEEGLDAPVRGPLLYQGLRSQSLLSVDSSSWSWDRLEGEVGSSEAFALLEQDLELAPSAARDPALALLASLDAQRMTEWNTLPRGVRERWLLEAIASLDPASELTASDTDAIRAYAARAPARVRSAATALAQLGPRGAAPEEPTTWSAETIRLALFARRDLGTPSLIWEESHVFTTDLSWSSTANGTLSQPLATLDFDVRWPGERDADLLGRAYEPGAIATLFEVSATTVAMEVSPPVSSTTTADWSGRVLLATLRGEIDVQLSERSRMSFEEEMILERGTVTTVRPFEVEWPLRGGDRVWTFHLLATLEGTEPGASGRTGTWPNRIANSVAALAAGETIPIELHDLWRVVDPVLDLDVREARADALSIVANAGPSPRATSHSPQWRAYATLCLGSTVSRPYRGSALASRTRDKSMEAAWGAVITDSPDARATLLDPGFALLPSDGASFDLREIANQRGWVLGERLAKRLQVSGNPGGESAWRDLAHPPWFLIGVLTAWLTSYLGRRRPRPKRTAADPTQGDTRGAWIPLFLMLSFLQAGANGWLIPRWVFPALIVWDSIRWARAAPKGSNVRRSRWSAVHCFLFALVYISVGTAPWVGITSLGLGLLTVLVSSTRETRQRWKRAEQDLRKRQRARLFAPPSAAG